MHVAAASSMYRALGNAQLDEQGVEAGRFLAHAIALQPIQPAPSPTGRQKDRTLHELMGSAHDKHFILCACGSAHTSPPS